MPVGGNWKTTLRVQDGRTLTALPIFLPEDASLKASEVPADASFTRDFVPEIDILQRERTDYHPAWIWTAANMVVLLCSLGIILGICTAVSRVSRTIAEYEAQEGTDHTPTLTS